MADEHGDVSMCLQMPQFVGKPLTSRRPPKVAVAQAEGDYAVQGDQHWTLETGVRAHQL